MRYFKRFLMAGAIITVGVFGVCNAKAQAISTPSKYFDAKYYTDPIPDGYYDDIDLSLKGNDFKNVLGPIISRNFRHHSYGDNSTVLKYTDPDPNHPGNIICFYSGQSLASGSWNKEHVWAKSHGFPQTGANPYCDAHHLRPTLNKINSDRGNLDFGESNSAPDAYGNRHSDVFEPRDEVKGDVARIMFYMETRYKADYNLELVNSRKTSTGSPRFGGLQTLIKWHYEDPVSKEEIYRNNVIYEEFQHNRNPYIDHPEWVALAYPNDYDDGSDIGGGETDQAKVNKTINAINKLPAKVTLDDKDDINAAKSLYSALSFSEKRLVTNYQKLKDAIALIDKLENPKGEADSEIEGPSEPVGEEISIAEALKKAVAAGEKGTNERYVIKGKITEIKHPMWGNITITDGNDSIYAHSCYAANGKDLFEKINPAPQPGDTVKLSVKLGTYETRNGVKAEALNAWVLSVNEPEVKPDEKPQENASAASFVLENTKASLKLSLASSLDADFRIGIRIKASSFDSKAKYGIIAVEGDRKLTKGLQDVNSISEVTKTTALEMTPVRVNAEGVADSNGEYYQFAWVITNMEGHYKDALTGAAYMELDGKLYFSNPIKASLASTSEYYLDNNLITDKVIIDALKDLLK